MNPADRIFYLIPIPKQSGDIVNLYLPSDLITQNAEITSSLGFGVFTLLRTPHNRGKTRYISFPAVIGAGVDSRSVDLTLQSTYRDNKIKNNRFSFVQDTTIQQLEIKASFVARRFPPEFRLAGTAAKFSNYSIWALIPDDREHLERLWTEYRFYLTGHGAIEENNNVPDA